MPPPGQFFIGVTHMSDQENRKKSLWTLSKPEHEAELIHKQDSFFFRATPRWFEFVGWLLILGSLDYLSSQTKHWFVYFVYALYGISYLFLYFYLQSFLYNFPFYRFLPEKLVKSDKFAYRFSITVGFILLIITYFLLNSVVKLFAVR